MTTEDLWRAFAQGGVMVHCIRYGKPDARYGRGFREALEGEVVTCPNNVAREPVPAIVRTQPVAADDDPVAVARENSAVAARILRAVVRRTGLTFRFSGESARRPFVFDGRNPTVLVEVDEAVELDAMPVTVRLSAVGCGCAAEPDR